MEEDIQEEKYFEDEQYEKLLELKPDDFYLHLPIEIPYTKWLFEFRLQLLLMFGLDYNYFAMRHRLNAEAKWFSDWVFLNHYIYDYLDEKKWKPKLFDRLRFEWLMNTGYLKEFNSYTDLCIKHKNNQLGIKENQFLKIYAQSIYWEYFDCKRNDELAFFRLGLDADQALADEDHPLFPNIAYSFPDDPKLAYFSNKKMFTEFIPKRTSWAAKQLHRIIINRKWSKNNKVDYFDIRPMFNPETTKIYDLEYLFHKIDKHDGETNIESKMSSEEYLWIFYKHEIYHLAEQFNLPKLKNLPIKGPKRTPNPLYVAYKKRWLNKNPVKEFGKVFDGVTKDEYEEIVNKQYEFLDRKLLSKSNKKPNDKDKKRRIEDLIMSTFKQK